MVQSISNPGSSMSLFNLDSVGASASPRQLHYATSSSSTSPPSSSHSISSNMREDDMNDLQLEGQNHSSDDLQKILNYISQPSLPQQQQIPYLEDLTCIESKDKQEYRNLNQCETLLKDTTYSSAYDTGHLGSPDDSDGFQANSSIHDNARLIKDKKKEDKENDLSKKHEELVKRREQGHSFSTISRDLDLSVSSVKRAWYKYQKFQDTTDRRKQNGRKSALSQNELDHMRREILNNPKVTAEELKDALQLSISIRSVRRARTKLGFEFVKGHGWIPSQMTGETQFNSFGSEEEHFED